MAYLLGHGVKPIGDIGAGDLFNRGAQLAKLRTVISEERSQIVDTVEEADPAIVRGAVEGNLLWRVVSAELVRLGQMFVTVPTLLGVLGSWNSSRHLKY